MKRSNSFDVCRLIYDIMFLFLCYFSTPRHTLSKKLNPTYGPLSPVSSDIAGAAAADEQAPGTQREQG